MASSSGWPPDGSHFPPLSQELSAKNMLGPGRRTMPDFMDPDGAFGQLQILRIQGKNGAPLPIVPFIIRRSIQRIVGGRIEGAFPEAGGKSYAIKTRNTSSINKLLEMSRLDDGTEVEVIEHPVHNQIRLVVSCRDVVNVDTKTLEQELSDQNVKEVRRITRPGSGEERINTPTLILTLRGTCRPEFINFGYIRCHTRPYYPNPMQCFNCWAFRHTSKWCKNTTVCGKCSQGHPSSKEEPCDSPVYCGKCKSNDHGISEKSCPEFKRQVDIERVRVDQEVSYGQAARIVESKNHPLAPNTTAAVVGISPPGTNELTSPNAEIVALTKRIDSLIEALQSRDNRIAQLEQQLAMLNGLPHITTEPDQSPNPDTIIECPPYMKAFLAQQQQMFSNAMKHLYTQNLKMQEEFESMKKSMSTISPPNAKIVDLKQCILSATQPAEKSLNSNPSATTNQDGAVINILDLSSSTISETDPIEPEEKTSALDSTADISDEEYSDPSPVVSPNTIPAKSFDTPRPKTIISNLNDSSHKTPTNSKPTKAANKRTATELSPLENARGNDPLPKHKRQLPATGRNRSNKQ